MRHSLTSFYFHCNRPPRLSPTKSPNKPLPPSKPLPPNKPLPVPVIQVSASSSSKPAKPPPPRPTPPRFTPPTQPKGPRAKVETTPTI